MIKFSIWASGQLLNDFVLSKLQGEARGRSGGPPQEGRGRGGGACQARRHQEGAGEAEEADEEGANHPPRRLQNQQLLRLDRHGTGVRDGGSREALRIDGVPRVRLKIVTLDCRYEDDPIYS